MIPLPKALLIDIDNTVYDYAPCHAAGMEHAHRAGAGIIDEWKDRKTFEREYENAKRVRKMRLRDQAAIHSRILTFKLMLENRLGGSSIPEVLHLDDAYWNAYFSSMERDDWVMETLELARANHIRTAWLSNFTIEHQIKKLKRLQLEDAADYLFTSEEVGADKPDPKIGLLALNVLRLEPSDVWLIGDDAENDVGLAKVTGMFCVLLVREQVPYHSPIAHRAAANWKEIHNLLHQTIK